MGILKVTAKGLMQVVEKALPAERKAISTGKTIFSGSMKNAKGAEKMIKKSVLSSARKADNAAADAVSSAGHSVFEAAQTVPDKGFTAAAKRLNAIRAENPLPAGTPVSTPVLKQAEKAAVETTAAKTALTPDQIWLKEDFPPFSILLSNSEKYAKLSDETKLWVNRFCNSVKTYGKAKNQSLQYKNFITHVRYLIDNCGDESVVKIMMAEPKNFQQFISSLASLFSSTKKCVQDVSSDLTAFRCRLAAMSVLNPKSYNALWNSKGMKEITAGRLNVSYLRDVKVFDKIDEDFFYKMFDRIEKSNIERLKKSGIDSDLVMKYLNLPECDKLICIQPKFADHVITSLEKVNNPELVNKILGICGNFDRNLWTKFDDACFIKLIQNAITDPKTVAKVMRLEKSNLYTASELVELMKNKQQFKISDELFEQYLKFEKAHPDCCYPSTLRYLNEFITNGGDEKVAKKIFDNAENIKSSIDVTQLFHGATTDNRELLNKCLEKGSVTPVEAFKFNFLADNGASLKDEEISKLFKDTYTPLMKELSSKSGREFFAKRLSNLKAKAPALYQKLMDINITELIKNPEFDPSMLEKYIHALDNPAVCKRLADTRLFDLIKDKKVNPRIILQMEQGALRPEILEDIQKLLKGESLVKKFKSTKVALKNTILGDVVSIDGKMYINNNGKLDPWKMSEEKFNELFPLVDRFSVRQNIGDCYLLSTLDALYTNPHTRGTYYKMFEQNGKSVLVTIPGYKDFKGTTYFKSGTFNPTRYSADGPLHLQMLERSYSRSAIRNPANMDAATASAPLNPETTNNNRFLSNRITGGFQRTVMNEIIPEKNGGHPLSQLEFIRNDEAVDWVKVFSNDKDYILSAAYWPDTARKNGHAITVSGYDEATQSVVLRNPWYTAIEYKIPLDEFLSKDKFKSLSIFHVG